MPSSVLDIRKLLALAEKNSDVLGTAPTRDFNLHPFDKRNIHPSIDRVSRRLFDGGHYEDATFRACKLLEDKVRAAAKSQKSGQKLMNEAFGGDQPKVALTSLDGESGRDEQEGFRFLFMGTIAAIRNPRGHVVEIGDGVDECLDHLSLVSLLLRQLDYFE